MTRRESCTPFNREALFALVATSSESVGSVGRRLTGVEPGVSYATSARHHVSHPSVVFTTYSVTTARC